MKGRRHHPPPLPTKMQIDRGTRETGRTSNLSATVTFAKPRCAINLSAASVGEIQIGGAKTRTVAAMETCCATAKPFRRSRAGEFSNAPLVNSLTRGAAQGGGHAPSASVKP